MSVKIVEPAKRWTDEKKADMMVYDYNEDGGFWVGERFGCVHHTPKS